MHLKHIAVLSFFMLWLSTSLSYADSGEIIIDQIWMPIETVESTSLVSSDWGAVDSWKVIPQTKILTWSTQKPTPNNQKVDIVGSPLSKDSILWDSIDDLKFIINKELESVVDIKNINTAHEVTQRIKSDLLEQTNLVQHKISFSTNSLYYNSSKQDIQKLQEVFKTIWLYKWEINWKYDSIIKTVQQYQINNNIVKNAQDGGYGRMWPKTKVQLEKDYLQAINDKVYQEILSVVKAEIEKIISQKNTAPKTSTQDTPPHEVIFTWAQNNEKGVSTGEIQKILDDQQVKIHTDVKLNASILLFFIAEIYMVLSLIAVIGYIIYRYQRRKKLYF